MTDFQKFYRNEGDYPQLDGEGACRRLSAAIACRTVNGTEGCDGEFAKLRQLVHDSFPAVSARAVTETVGRSLLIRIEGRDKSLKPALFMSHLDVVGVEAGTEGDWTYGPFSGEIAQGYIWGRGALDIKCQVFGVLEAAEYLLSRGCSPERDVYLAFGEDEETFNTGALAMAKLLESRGVQLEFLLDEGGGSIESGAVYCAPGVNVCQIHLAEKGYADLQLTAKGKGGHSSNPFGGSSLEHMAEAISAICASAQAAEMPKALEQCLRAIAPYVSEEPGAGYPRQCRGNNGVLLHRERALPPHCHNHRPHDDKRRQPRLQRAAPGYHRQYQFPPHTGRQRRGPEAPLLLRPGGHAGEGQVHPGQRPLPTVGSLRLRL